MHQDDDPTRLVGRPSPPPLPGQDPGDQPTRIMRNPEPHQPDPPTSEPTRVYGHDTDDDPTELFDPSSPEPAAPQVEADEKTVLYRPGRKGPASAASPDQPEASDQASQEEISTDDPVVGWLVVIEGKGAGTSHNLGYGINSIGRAPSQRVSLDYDDPTISRENHISIAYDPKARQFHAMPGSGSSMGYLEGGPILSPTKLKSREKITLGDTTLSFIPFCNSEFDWEDA